MVAAINPQDELNHRAWANDEAVRWLGAPTGFITPGERAGLTHASANLGRRPVLELGVGPGRTIPFTKPLTDEYLAIDYLPIMVDACRKRFPDTRIEVGDARSLAGLPDGHFGLVTFAWNGIDAVSHADRRLVLRAVHRVLAPDGRFFFSTLNLDGPTYRERPWRVPLRPTWNPYRFARRILGNARIIARGTANWLRVRRIGEVGPGYAVAPLAAHDFSVLAHYTTLPRQLDELRDEGFTDTVVFRDENGARPDGDLERTAAFHFVARRAD